MEHNYNVWQLYSLKLKMDLTDFFYTLLFISEWKERTKRNLAFYSEWIMEKCTQNVHIVYKKMYTVHLYTCTTVYQQ